MTLSALSPRNAPSAWVFALIGVLASVPVTIGLRIWFQSDNATAGGIMVIGAFLAGALAATRSTEPYLAGARAGFLGGVAGSVEPLPAVVDGPLWGLVAFAVFTVAAVLIGWFLGTACGQVGGWVTSTVDRRRSTNAGA